jgi:predicted RNase H-like HicB family nuclease
MTAMVAERPNKPVLVIPAEANDFRLYVLPKRDNRVDALLAIGTSVDVAAMTYTIELERETDGRWIAEVPDLAGVLSCGASREQAWRVQALALRVIAERLENDEAPPDLLNVTSIANFRIDIA